VGNTKYFQIIFKMSGPDLGSHLLYKKRLQFRDRLLKRYFNMSKLVLTLIASMFAVAAFAADVAPVAAKPVVAAPVTQATMAKVRAHKAMGRKSHAAKAVKPAAKASAPVAAAK
jgi:hypothetical protein